MPTFRGRFGGAVSSNGEVWNCTVYSSSPFGSLGAALTAYTAMVGTIWAGITTYMLPATTLDSLIVDQLDPVTGRNTTQAVATVAHVGTSANPDPAPPQTSIVVSLKSALATKAGRGRFYLPAPDATHVTTTGEMPGAVQTAASAAVGAAFTAMATASYQPVVFHRLTVTTDDVVSVSVLDIYGTQRRRRDKLIGSRVVTPL